MKDTGEDALIERLERVTVRDEVGDWADVRRRAERLGTRRRRVRAPRLVAFAAAALALVAIAAPALGLHEPVVRFFEGEPAPEDVQIDFATLDQGVPTPEWRTGVIASETRKVMEAYFAGKRRVLWVAPTKYGGLCLQWSAGGGGCDRLGTVPLSVSWGVSRPFRVPGAGPPRPEDIPIDYLDGYAHAKWVHSVEIRFEDGEVVEPRIVWVSEPIDAGFFAYDIPEEHRRPGHRVQAVVGLDADGEIVTEVSGLGRDGLRAPPVDALTDEKRKVVEVATRRGPAVLWTAPTRYEGRCAWLELAGRAIAVERCTAKGYENDVGIAARFLPMRYGVLFFAAVDPRVASIDLRFADGDEETVRPKGGFVLYEIPAGHLHEGHEATEIVPRRADGSVITRMPVSVSSEPQLRCHSPLPLPGGAPECELTS